MNENVKELKAVDNGRFDIVIYLNDNEIAQFEDILGYQIGSHWAAVSMKDGSTTAYPITRIKTVRHYPVNTKKE